jgi:hypothetical protein
MAAHSGNIASGVEYAALHRELAKKGGQAALVPANVSFCGSFHDAVSISGSVPSNRGKPRNRPIRIACVQTEIRTEHLPSTYLNG